MPDRRPWHVLASAVALSGLAAACIAATHARPTQPVPGPTMVFADEFEQDVLDRGRWTTCYWWDDGGCTNSGNDELEWYLPGNVEVSDGVLRLEARRTRVLGADGKSHPYTSGTVTTGRSHDDDDGEAVTRGHTWRGAHSTSGWHRYGLTWTPEELVWLVDGKERWRYSNASHVPDEPMYLVIDLAVGGDWPGTPTSSTRFPAVLEVDYVRVWQ